MKKICVVITARTSYTKIKPILKAIKRTPELELQIICAGSAILPRYGDVDRIIEEDGFYINERLHIVVEGENLLTSAKTTGLGMIEYASAFQRLSPDCVFVMADRYEQMAAAVAATYMNIPLAHAQGGEVSGNIDEKVRHAISKLADLHFPATKRAHDWLIKMGEDPEYVIFSGCPSTDLCEDAIKTSTIRFDVYDKYSGVGAKPSLEKGYIIVMQHPVTTEFGGAREQAMETLSAIEHIDLPTLWFWPNLDAGSDETAKAIRMYRENSENENIHFFRNMAPQDFLQVLNGASVIVGNSSCGIRESSYLGVPSVNIGSRQNNRERSPNVIDVDYSALQIQDAIQKHLDAPRPEGTYLYGDGKCAEKIAKTLAKAQLRSHKTLHYSE